jgi:uroporphyrinogen decarboxylase
MTSQNGMSEPELARKERVRRALFLGAADRIPTQINFTNSFGSTMATHFGVSVERLPEFLGNHILRLNLSHDPRFSEDGSQRFDWWGVGFSTQEEGYFASFSPMADSKDIDSHLWPDPHAPALLQDAEAAVAANGERYFIIPNLGFALFERAWTLRGFEQFLIDMVTDPGYVGELLDRIVDIQLSLIHRYLDLGVDGGYFGDDYGSQRSLLISPRLWRTLIKPRLSRLFAPFIELGLPVILHSDGQIQQILPDLVEIGLTTLNPVQPEVLDLEWLSEHYGGRLSFYGGVSTQSVLPNGTPNEVRSAVSDAIRKLAPDGTGLLLAPSHRLMSDVPLTNVEAMIEQFQKANG